MEHTLKTTSLREAAAQETQRRMYWQMQAIAAWVVCFVLCLVLVAQGYKYSRLVEPSPVEVIP